MEILAQLGVALGLASLAGINLYLTVLITGLAIRFDWIALAAKHEGLAVLGNEWIIGVAAVLFVVEFIADKIPWLDSAWDSVHTILRPAGGLLLALGALGDLDPAVSVVAALLFGGVSLTTHAAKASSRLLVNASPEPVSNSVASVAEDGLVLGGLGLLALSPAVAFFVFVVFVVLAAFLVVKIWGGLRRGAGALWRRMGGRGEVVADG